jgi:hypothetical protein
LLVPELEQLLAGRPQRLGARTGVGERHLKDGPRGRQRGAQLVGRVRDEVPLGLERGLQASEQAVQRAAEFPELVVGAGQAQPLVQGGGGGRAGRGRDDPERPQGAVGDEPPQADRRHGEDRQRDAGVEEDFGKVGDEP